MINSSPRRAAYRRRGRVFVESSGLVEVVTVARNGTWNAGDMGFLVRAVERLSGRDRPVGINLRGVVRLPLGFWDRLCGWAERGIDVSLIAPEPEVRSMLWFRLSAKPRTDLGRDVYAVRSDFETPSRDERTASPGESSASPMARVAS